MSAPSRPQSRRAARRDAIRRDLLAAFERLIEEGETFASLSVDRLATEAGISRSTFYVYFEDKGDLLTALAQEVMDDLVAAAEEWFTLTDVGREDLERALWGMAATYLPHQAVMLAVSQTTSLDPRVREQYSTLIENARARFAEHLESCAAAGTVTADLNPVHAADWLTWMTERGLGRLVVPADPDAREALMRSLVDVMWNALYRESPT